MSEAKQLSVTPLKAGRIFSAIPKIMSAIPVVAKDKKNPQQNYSFRGIDDLYNALQKPLSDNGVFYVPNVLTKEREERQTKTGGTLIYTVLTVQFNFFADDGSFVSATTVGEAMDSGDKSANKAMSAALKYALLQVFCIPTEDDNDTENHSHEVGPRQTAKTTPGQPTTTVNTSVTPNKPAAPALANPGDWVVPFGQKYKGLALKEIYPEEIESYMSFLKSSAAKDGKPLNANAMAFINNGEAYLDSLTRGDDSGEFEDISFP